MPFSSCRRIVAALVLVLFTAQNYVTQTHIHRLDREARHATLQVYDGGFRLQPTPSPGKPGPFDNPTTCPFCQDLALAGHYTAPGAMALMLPAQFVFPAVTSAALPAIIAAASHIWRGRAPPQA